MSENLTKIREWTDGEDDGEWPAPPSYVEYRVEGKMRLDVLKRVGRPSDDTANIRLIEGEIEGGYSEFTVEFDFPIEVWVDDNGQSQRVFSDESYARDDSMAAFLRWLEGTR